MIRILPILVFCFTAFGSLAQVVITKYGPIQGNTNNGVYEFLGIPFARPPIVSSTDTLRWKPPLTPQPWITTRLTQQFAPACPQKRFDQGDTTYVIEGNEDCLYLNVWSPLLDSNAKLPVLVFIHGGGNQQGAASSMSGGTHLYQGRNMAQRGNAVIVTLQYRLGPLGFLVHPALDAESPDAISGNYAVLDQILALEWVRDNITQFGGDSDRVMIFGESAGGVNVGNLMMTGKAAGLFHRACIQSAAPTLRNYQTASNEGQDFVNGFISSGTPAQKLSYMRLLPPDSLIKDLDSPFSGGVVSAVWGPVLDGKLFIKNPMSAVMSGQYNKVPLLLGSNADEVSLTAPVVVTPAMHTAFVMSTLPAQHQTTALSLYPPGSNNSEARQSYVAMLSDMQFTSTNRRVAQCVSLNQNEPVWRYLLTYKHSLAVLQPYGSYHGMELAYIFNTWENTSLGSGILFKPSDDSMQNNLLQYWVNFAATGNPNGVGLVNWPGSSAQNDCYMELKASPIGTQCGIRTAASDFWDDVVFFTGCTSSLGTEGNSSSSNLLIYPNPSNDRFFIEFEDTEYEIKVFNAIGQEVFSGQNLKEIDLGCQDRGFYLIRVQGSGFRASRVLILN
jgi:para-nitrobenzyl esterase